MVKERNREIEQIIEKLGDETHDTQKQLVQQYEAKVDEVNKKAAQDLAEERVRAENLARKLKHEQDQKNFVDENMKVLTRRVADLEDELNEASQKKQKLEDQLRQGKDEVYQLESKQDQLRREVESQYSERLAQKESEIRDLSVKLQETEHKFELELEQLR